MSDPGRGIGQKLCAALEAQREGISREYVRILRNVGPHYAARPDEELQETTSRAIGAYFAVICAQDWGPMEAFIHDIAEKRFPLRFPLSEVQKAWAVFREICHPILIQTFWEGGMDEALLLVDTTVDRAINRFSDTYQQLHLEEIRKTSADLAEANRRLQSQYDEVAEAARIKNQFFANMSHELRSPLNSVIGYTELLLDGIDGPLSDEQRRDLERILASSHYLLKLINNILDMTKIEAGRMEVEPRIFEVRALVDEAIDTVIPLAYRKRIELRSELDDDVKIFRSDPDKIKQVLINLLSNAVKFTDRGEIVCAGWRDGDKLWFEVRDTGIGIAPQDRQLIFGKFYQIDVPHAREHRGTGLGLPLSRMLVELLGGQIRLQSETEKGSRFSFWIPEAGSDASVREDSRDESEAPTVLVIEDDPSSLELIQKVLESEAIGTVAARDGAEGLKLARGIRPSAITLDLLMPRVDGWEVLKALKADPATSDIPVIVVSCIDRREQGRRAGADAYLVKPIEREAFLQTLRTLLSQSDVRAENG